MTNLHGNGESIPDRNKYKLRRVPVDRTWSSDVPIQEPHFWFLGSFRTSLGSGTELGEGRRVGVVPLYCHCQCRESRGFPDVRPPSLSRLDRRGPRKG